MTISFLDASLIYGIELNAFNPYDEDVDYTVLFTIMSDEEVLEEIENTTINLNPGTHFFTGSDITEIQCKVTYISFGSLSTPKVTKKHPDRRLMDVNKAATYIKWVLDQPKDISLNELSIDPKQILADD